MSETDDTDELVLIPPDFFNCEPPLFEENCYFDVVDNLITQVTNLENRINSIDLSSLTSPQSSYMSSVRKYRSSDDVTQTQSKDGFESTQSTPQKPQTRRVASSGNFRSTNLNSEKFENNEYFSKNSLNIKDLEFMVKKIENQQKELDILSSCREKNDSSNDLNDSFQSLSSSSGDLTQITTIPNRLAAGSDFVASVSSKTDIRRKTPPDFRQNLRQRSSKLSPIRNNQRKTQFQRQYTETDTTSTTRGSESSFTQQSERYFNGFYDVNYMRKLEYEEKIKKQRYEQIIQQLQKQNYDMQEQLASAIRVDEAKDDAILRFHKAWEQVAIRLQTLVEERDALESEIKQLHVQHTRNFTQAAEKMTQQEGELKKMSLISQTNQEKTKEMEKLIVDLTNEIQRLNKKIDELEKELKVENDGYKELKEKLEQKEKELKVVNADLVVARGDVEKEKRKMGDFEKELGKLRDVLKEDTGILTEKDGLIDTLEKQNQKLMTEIDLHKNKEGELQKELGKIKETNDKEKLDLKYFYQEQVEKVVKEKLLDFQVQLERARGELEEDLKKREVIVAKTAATHIQQIADKHSIEISLLEEKHSEEVRLYQVQISQAQQLLDNLQRKLQHQQLKKHDMAKQLHKLMEAQWLEALKIINNGRSPIPTDCQDLTDQLNILTSKSYNNMEEVLEMSIDEAQEQQQNVTKNNQNNYQNVPIETFHMETPLTSRQPRKPEMEDVHKFIHMLMNKQNASPTGDHNQNSANMMRNATGNGQQVDFVTWQQQQQQDDGRKAKDKKIKPPWK